MDLHTRLTVTMDMNRVLRLTAKGPASYASTTSIIQRISSGLSFHCERCNFDLDPHCATSLTAIKRSCANLPRKVDRSPHHEHSDRCQKHTLTLLDHLPHELESPFGSKQSESELDDRSRYSKFLGITKGFAYACSKCSDCFDVRCTMEKSKPHKHPIAFFNTTSNKLNCEICRRSLHTPFFRCEECNFNIHVSCVPILPQIVKHRCHRHILSLRYSPIKYYPDEDENAEFYCNVCEELTDLFDPTYYCVDCHFVSHVHCAFSEEMHVLVEEWSLPFKLEESLSSADEATGASVEEHEAEGSRSSRNCCSLIELDEEIAELDGKIKRQETELSAMRKTKEELETRRASTEFWNYLDNGNILIS
ncbi:hypothetical protein Vadar_001944 [Vaccinium darrowii]|uniref:Uncharacterized protein n=1 Tax=Vaccinium darrowii TaxID=229202 RepID=A0ACB7Z1T0_9ERIC|nr:hypothetical protein Vadar_001944 [Vaccinium darrowii]